MKAYSVFSWSGKYDELYEEADQKYFLNETSARNYEKELQDKKREHDANELANERKWHKNKTEEDLMESIVHISGVVFDEIEIIEE